MYKNENREREKEDEEEEEEENDGQHVFIAYILYSIKFAFFF